MPPSRDLSAFFLGLDDDARAVDAYKALLGLYRQSIDWYLSEKERKRRWSRALRAVVLVLLTGGGLVPLLATVVSDLPSTYGYILLAAAGGLVVFDKYFGYSAAWARYITSATTLNASLLSIQLDWGSSFDRAEIDRWQLLKEYALRLSAIIEAETGQWVGDFGSGLEELGTSAHSPRTPGA
jgi:hypothetical protein